MLQLHGAAPLNFLVMWQWSLTCSSSLTIRFSQIQQVLLDWNCYSSSFMIKFFLKCFLITILQYSYTLTIVSMNLKAAFSTLQRTISLLNLSSTQTICKQNYKEGDLDIVLSRTFHSFKRFLNYTQNKHKFWMELVFVWNNF